MKQSAGLLLFKRSEEGPLFFLVHPGGPFFSKKNFGWWTVPKGEVNVGEDHLDTAKREFLEETGSIPKGDFIKLAPIIQKGGKRVYCWAFEGAIDIDKAVSNTFDLEWPPKSGSVQKFPEVDRFGWFGFEEAMLMINERQQAFLIELKAFLNNQ